MLATTLLVLLAAFVTGCGRRGAGAPAAKAPRVASLVPAATDLLQAMGAGEHLAAVSSYDRQVDQRVPRVGDYQSTDWEMLSIVRPQFLVVQMAPERIPQGFCDRADKLNIKIENVNIDRLDGVYATLRRLGQDVGEPQKAAALEESLKAGLDGVAQRVAGQPKVKALLVLDENGQGVVGPDTFLDSLLTIAGGRNAAAGLGAPYPSVDREKLMELSPAAAIQLLPDASPQTLAAAERFWKSMPDLPAVRDGRVYTITSHYCLLPGSHVVDLAAQFAAALHPGAPATTQSAGAQPRIPESCWLPEDYVGWALPTTNLGRRMLSLQQAWWAVPTLHGPESDGRP